MLLRPLRSLTAAIVLVAVGLLASSARADELDDARQFLAGRSELAAVAGTLVDRVGPGVYRLAPGAAAPAVFLVKQGSAWVALVPLEAQAAELVGLVPSVVRGDARAGAMFAIVGQKDSPVWKQLRQARR